MQSICWQNCNSFEDSDVIILGVPDETKSHSLRRGTSNAPSQIRTISNIRDSYNRGKNISLGFPLSGISSKVYDFGDISRTEISSVYDKIFSSNKIPILMGGDHSITTDVIKSVSHHTEPISIVYFDAHPDFVSSVGNYYGSVFTEILPYLDVESSIQIGIRTPEQEEIDNLKKHGIQVITPFDISEQGVRSISKKILDMLETNVYVSLDMDVVDPAFAPGVSVPVPMGLNNVDVTYIIKKIIQRGVIGLDLMEVCPEYDIKDRTSHLASRMIGEFLSAM